MIEEALDAVEVLAVAEYFLTKYIEGDAEPETLVTVKKILMSMTSLVREMYQESPRVDVMHPYSVLFFGDTGSTWSIN